MTTIHARMRLETRRRGVVGTTREGVGRAAIRCSGKTRIPSADLMSVDATLVVSAPCRSKMTGISAPHRLIRTSHAFGNVVDIQKHEWI